MSCCATPDCPWQAHTDTGKCHYCSLGEQPEEDQSRVDRDRKWPAQTLAEARTTCLSCLAGLPHNAEGDAQLLRRGES